MKSIEALRTSVRATREIGGLLLSVVAPMVMMTILIILSISQLDLFVWFKLIVTFCLIVCSFAYMQTLLFTFYWIQSNRKKGVGTPDLNTDMLSILSS